MTVHPETEAGAVIPWPMIARPQAHAQPGAVEALADAVEYELRARRRDRETRRRCWREAQRAAFDAAPWPHRLPYIIAGAEPGYLLVAVAALVVALCFAAELV